jgi:hypothetical protein
MELVMGREGREVMLLVLVMVETRDPTQWKETSQT